MELFTQHEQTKRVLDLLRSGKEKHLRFSLVKDCVWRDGFAVSKNQANLLFDQDHLRTQLRLESDLPSPILERLVYACTYSLRIVQMPSVII